MSCGVNTDDPLVCGVCLEDEFTGGDGASPLATGAVPYPDVADEPAETWTPPGYPLEAGVGDTAAQFG